MIFSENTNDMYSFSYCNLEDEYAFSPNCDTLQFSENFNDVINNKPHYYFMHDLGIFYYDYGVLHVVNNGEPKSIWVVKVNNQFEQNTIKENLVKIWDKEVGYLIDIIHGNHI